MTAAAGITACAPGWEANLLCTVHQMFRIIQAGLLAASWLPPTPENATHTHHRQTTDASKSHIPAPLPTHTHTHTCPSPTPTHTHTAQSPAPETRPQQRTNSKVESSILALTWWSVPAQPLCAPERRGRAGSSWSSACGCWDTAAGWRWLSGTGNDLRNTRLQTGWQLAQPKVQVTLGQQGQGQHTAHLSSILNSYDPASTKKPFTTLSQTPLDAAA